MKFFPTASYIVRCSNLYLTVTPPLLAYRQIHLVSIPVVLGLTPIIHLHATSPVFLIELSYHHEYGTTMYVMCLQVASEVHSTHLSQAALIPVVDWAADHRQKSYTIDAALAAPPPRGFVGVLCASPLQDLGMGQTSVQRLLGASAPKLLSPPLPPPHSPCLHKDSHKAIGPTFSNSPLASDAISRVGSPSGAELRHSLGQMAWW